MIDAVPSGHGARAHSKFSPSGAERWIRCPASIKLSEPFPNTSSIYADEGTAAHELAQICWERTHDALRYVGHYVNLGESKPLNKLAVGGRSIAVTDEMAEGVQVYLDALTDIAGEDGEVEIEQKIDLRFIHDGMWGTGDGLIYKPATQHLYVCDLKFGVGYVDVDDNYQLSTYALGAAKRFHNRGVRKVTLVIVQPRAFGAGGPVRKYDTSLIDLLGFANVLKKAVAEAEGDNPKVAAGDWCRYCRAKPVCPALRKAAEELVSAEFGPTSVPELSLPSMLTREEVGVRLRQAGVVETWIKGLRAHAFDMAKAGQPPEGWKCVEKRALRKWTDEDSVVRHLLGTGCDRTDIFSEKIKSPTQIEKALGKAVYSEIAEFVIKKSSGVTLAPEEDKRPAVMVDAASEFSTAD